jgi:hypothetical protein
MDGWMDDKMNLTQSGAISNEITAKVQTMVVKS